MTEHSLSESLKEETRKIHRELERTLWVKSMMKGKMSAQSYIDYLSLLQTIYSTLELELERRKSTEFVSSLYFPSLFRSKAIQEDLNHLFSSVGVNSSSNWVSSSLALKNYIERIEKISNEEPIRLIAHSYARYLGDLFGGQHIKKHLFQYWKDSEGNRFLETEEKGLSFYSFPEISQPKQFALDFKLAMDSLPLTESQKRAIIEEGLEVFRLNMEIMNQMSNAVEVN
eukprot:TRINITY_DN2812_c0_g1_i2.p1 TRINITY_DN2812_c0_g1~~TRINITY_DN2812_c0_g1_i2.p1  ORF type:complete len:228 (+),score=86.90 TRINITY_DN2812_c0_g1_i2:73-756(+)